MVGRYRVTFSERSSLSRIEEFLERADVDRAEVVRAWCERGVPVAPARTWLLIKGWRKRGLLDSREVPGR